MIGHREFVADRLKSKDKNTMAVVEVLETYKPRYAFVLSAYYGLDRRKMTLVEIGEILGVSRSRVYQLKNKALSDLWKYLVDDKEFSVVPWVGKRVKGEGICTT